MAPRLYHFCAAGLGTPREPCRVQRGQWDSGGTGTATRPHKAPHASMPSSKPRPGAPSIHTKIMHLFPAGLGTPREPCFVSPKQWDSGEPERQGSKRRNICRFLFPLTFFLVADPIGSCKPLLERRRREGEREVWRERVRGRVLHAWHKPGPGPGPGPRSPVPVPGPGPQIITLGFSPANTVPQQCSTASFMMLQRYNGSPK